jgi:hypothetical protein
MILRLKWLRSSDTRALLQMLYVLACLAHKVASAGDTAPMQPNPVIVPCSLQDAFEAEMAVLEEQTAAAQQEEAEAQQELAAVLQEVRQLSEPPVV